MIIAKIKNKRNLMKFYNVNNLISFLKLQTNTTNIKGKKYSYIYNVELEYDFEELKKYPFSIEHTNEVLPIINNTIISGKKFERYSGYRDDINRQINDIMFLLNNQPNARNIVIRFTDNQCLLSIQFFVKDKTLNAIANFRSEELEEWHTFDICFLLYLTREIKDRLQRKFKYGKLYMNIANAHVEIK